MTVATGSRKPISIVSDTMSLVALDATRLKMRASADTCQCASMPLA